MSEKHDDLFVWDASGAKKGSKKSTHKHAETELNEKINELTIEIEQQNNKIELLNNDLLRSRADFDNYRKRTRTLAAEDFNK